MTRNGKIARLPAAIREELNQRLLDGEQGKQLVLWLNSLPRVQALLKDKFHGVPISEVNLSQCRNDSVEIGSATVSVALAAVPPASHAAAASSPFGGVSPGTDVFGETPKTAVETTALPRVTESSRDWKDGGFPGRGAGEKMENRQRIRRILGICEGYDGSKNPELTLPPALRGAPVQASTSQYK
jgi:hypothetical protein